MNTGKVNEINKGSLQRAAEKKSNLQSNSIESKIDSFIEKWNKERNIPLLLFTSDPGMYTNTESYNNLIEFVTQNKAEALPILIKKCEKNLDLLWAVQVVMEITDDNLDQMIGRKIYTSKAGLVGLIKLASSNATKS